MKWRWLRSLPLLRMEYPFDSRVGDACRIIGPPTNAGVSGYELSVIIYTKVTKPVVEFLGPKPMLLIWSPYLQLFFVVNIGLSPISATCSSMTGLCALLSFSACSSCVALVCFCFADVLTQWTKNRYWKGKCFLDPKKIKWKITYNVFIHVLFFIKFEPKEQFKHKKRHNEIHVQKYM